MRCGQGQGAWPSRDNPGGGRELVMFRPLIMALLFALLGFLEGVTGDAFSSGLCFGSAFSLMGFLFSEAFSGKGEM